LLLHFLDQGDHDDRRGGYGDKRSFSGGRNYSRGEFFFAPSLIIERYYVNWEYWQILAMTLETLRVIQDFLVARREYRKHFRQPRRIQHI